MSLYNSLYEREGHGISPNEPEKKGFARFCQMVGRDLGQLLGTNLIVCVLCLPAALGVSLGVTLLSLPVTVVSSLLTGLLVGPAMLLLADCALRSLQNDPSQWLPRAKQTLAAHWKSACGFGCIIKGNAAVHNAVVGNGNGGLAQLFDIVKQAVNTAGAIQQAVLSMQVQVGELSLRLVWRGFWHNVSLCCCGKMRKSRSSYAAALRGLLRRWCDVLSCWFRLFKIFLLFRLC